MDITWDRLDYNRCPRYVRLIWSCGSGIRVFLKIIAVSCSYKGVPMLHTHSQPHHAHSSQYLHCPLAWEVTTQSHISAKLWVWSSPYEQGSALWHWASLARASPTCSLDDATDGCVVWWRVPGPQQAWHGVRLLLQTPNRYYYCINGQTTAVSSLTTLIKECFECTSIYVFSLQYIVPCMYPLYWTGVSCDLILVHQVGEGVIQVWEWHDPAMFMYVIHGTYTLLSPKSPRVHSGPLCKGFRKFWSSKKCDGSNYWDVTTCFFVFWTFLNLWKFLWKYLTFY